MQVLNVHRRVLPVRTEAMVPLFATLASKEDMMLATDLWPRMRLNQGLQVGSKGGHGPIRYTVAAYDPLQSIRFQFDMPGFDGFHEFKFVEMGEGQVELSHVIDMKTSGLVTLKWLAGIRWLHDAFIEDAFDKVEGRFTGIRKKPTWNWWVKLLRRVLG